MNQKQSRPRQPIQTKRRRGRANQANTPGAVISRSEIVKWIFNDKETGNSIASGHGVPGSFPDDSILRAFSRGYQLYRWKSFKLEVFYMHIPTDVGRLALGYSLDPMDFEPTFTQLVQMAGTRVGMLKSVAVSPKPFVITIPVDSLWRHISPVNNETKDHDVPFTWYFNLIAGSPNVVNSGFIRCTYSIEFRGATVPGVNDLPPPPTPTKPFVPPVLAIEKSTVQGGVGSDGD